MRETPTTRWLLIVVNSAFLLGAVVLPGFALHEDEEPISIRHVAACGPFGPVAGKHVDRDEICRRARKEVLRSLRTGRDPDWGDVFRDSIPKASKSPRQHPASRNPPQRADENQPRVTPRPSSRTEARPTEQVSPTSRADVKSSNGRYPSVPSETMNTPTRSPAPTAPAEPDGYTPGPAGWAGIAALLAVIGGAAFMVGRRQTSVQAAASIRGRIKRPARPKATSTTTTSCEPVSPDAHRIVHFAAKSVSLAGPGAEDAVRRLAVDVLLSRQGNAIELVISRPNAWRLFGVDAGTLQDDRIPGLVLTDDQAQSRAYLARQGSSRRLLITRDDEAEDLRALAAHQAGQLTVVSLSTRTEASLQVSADGEVTASAAGPPMPGRLPLLPSSEAFTQLMSMPTRARNLAN